MSPLRKELDANLKKMCQELGFKKSKYLYYKQINSDFTANIMFPCASYQIKYHILLSCAIGISATQVSSIFEQCAELDDFKVHSNTIQTNIGYLMPQNDYIEWDYSAESDPSIFFSQIQETIIRYAYPFFQKYSNIDNIIDALLDGEFYCPTDSDILFAIIFYLHGDKTLALKYLDKMVKKREANRGFHSILEENFNKNFRELLR